MFLFHSKKLWPQKSFSREKIMIYYADVKKFEKIAHTTKFEGLLCVCNVFLNKNQEKLNKVFFIIWHIWHWNNSTDNIDLYQEESMNRTWGFILKSAIFYLIQILYILPKNSIQVHFYNQSTTFIELQRPVCCLFPSVQNYSSF